MDIRKLADSELKQILLLSPQAVFEGTLGEVLPSNEKIEHLVKTLFERESYYLIASHNGKLMGWILIGASKDQFTDKMNGFIYELFVIEEFRGNGISKRLMRAAIDHLKQDGHFEIPLSAFAGNHAIKLYKKMRFGIRTVTMSLTL